MISIKRLFLILLALYATSILAQEADSTSIKILHDITIVGQKSLSDIHQLPQIVGTNIYAGKKSSLVVLENVQGNVVTNTMRQVIAKVPGIYIWESEGSGIQIGIASRGLSPNRSWEFNVRQNGYDISADPYGYPEAYYNPQLQSVQRIEIVRGHGALQYGPQMGGMVNYILKNGSEFSKPFQVESCQTIGSNGLVNTYNAIGGKTSKFNYYSFFDHRQANGWRKNNQYKSTTGSGTVTYKASNKFSFTAEMTTWEMLSQQPGGLTDAQFLQNAKQSLRARNWLNLSWQTVALTSDFIFNSHQRLIIKMFHISGDRNSVGFNPSAGIVIKDSINTTTGEHNFRTIDIDRYRNYGMEARYIHHYNLGNQESSLSAGIRLYTGTTHRFRGGKGSSGTHYDIKLEPSAQWNADIDFQSRNAAVFLENLFRISHKLVLIPGLRYEYIQANADGYSGITNSLPVDLKSQERRRGFLIGGIGSEFQITSTTLFYANATQSYRPMQFADLTTPPTTDEIDPNLSDARGLNIDVGYRGNVKEILKFDVSVFQLQYNNRIGTIKHQRNDGSFYNYRTNIGSSETTGIEAFSEINLCKALRINPKFGDVIWFGSYAHNNARYNNLKVVTVANNALQETNFKNKQVEYAPRNIFRSGLSYYVKGFSASIQYNFNDRVYTDANNTEAPTANGQNGLVPSYTIMDATFGYKHKSGVSLKSGINNLNNARYFTRRSGGYPGPGVLPSDGRNFFLTIVYLMK